MMNVIQVLRGWELEILTLEAKQAPPWDSVTTRRAYAEVAFRREYLVVPTVRG